MEGLTADQQFRLTCRPDSSPPSTGLRAGELVALRGSDVIRHGRQVSVRVSGADSRVVPAGPPALRPGIAAGRPGRYQGLLGLA